MHLKATIRLKLYYCTVFSRSFGGKSSGSPVQDLVDGVNASYATVQMHGGNSIPLHFNIICIALLSQCSFA